MQELKLFLTSTVIITGDDLTTILSYFKPKSLCKGQLLLKLGQIVTHYYFLKSGGLRFYYDQDRELTAWIVQPDEFFTEISSLNPEVPTRFNIEAVEPAELYCISKKEMEMLYRQIPAWQEFGRKTWENMAIRMINEIIRFQTMTVEERYLEFLKKTRLYATCFCKTNGLIPWHNPQCLKSDT